MSQSRRDRRLRVDKCGCKPGEMCGRNCKYRTTKNAGKKRGNRVRDLPVTDESMHYEEYVT